MLLEPEYNDTDPYKWELINPEVQNILSEAVEEAIAAFCQSHPNMAVF
ncbi:MAG: hypothetical protein F6J93_29810 [Oscillatoria sp. SIO1A7]|nr:hypothetical protein [Oscillatoria sp. SIO1A7]